MRAINFVSIVWLVVGATIGGASAQSGSRGDGHAEHHDMYKEWQRPDVGGSCCNAQSADDPNGDCRPTTAYLGDDGWWRARVRPGPNGYIVVPPNKILNRAADGRCHICERYGAVICFQPCDPRAELGVSPGLRNGPEPAIGASDRRIANGLWVKSREHYLQS